MRLNELKHMINLQARVRFSSYDELKITRPRMRQKFRADTGVSITVARIPFIRQLGIRDQTCWSRTW